MLAKPLKKEKQIKILLTEEEIKESIKLLAKRIHEDYTKKEITEIYLLFVLKGSFIFAADLIRELSKLNLKMKIDAIKISSYEGTKSGKINICLSELLINNLDNKNILIIDDILDTGKTLHTLKWNIKRYYKPKSLEFCCLLKKEQKINDVYLNVNYIGFVIPNRFIVGYGLDYNGLYRELPYIAIYPGE